MESGQLVNDINVGVEMCPLQLPTDPTSPTRPCHGERDTGACTSNTLNHADSHVSLLTQQTPIPPTHGRRPRRTEPGNSTGRTNSLDRHPRVAQSMFHKFHPRTALSRTTNVPRLSGPRTGPPTLNNGYPSRPPKRHRGDSCGLLRWWAGDVL